jgi:hypothetical protein
MDNEFATKELNRAGAETKSVLDLAELDLKDELLRRLAQKEFYGTVSLQINFRSGKYNWHRITSEFTRGAGLKS